MFYLLIILSNAVVVVGIFLIMFYFFNSRISEQQLELLSVLINTKDRYTYRHQKHVSALVNLFYGYLPKEIRKKINRKKLVKVAKMHDIGKLFIPDAILTKPEKLTPEEYETIKTHAAMGAGVLDNTSYKKLSNFVLCHHEWINGTGYYRAEGKQIPIEAQIISICDVFSALVNNRPYRKGMVISEALKIIKDSAQTQFDAALVECFLKIDFHKFIAIDTLLKETKN